MSDLSDNDVSGPPGKSRRLIEGSDGEGPSASGFEAGYRSGQSPGNGVPSAGSTQTANKPSPRCPSQTARTDAYAPATTTAAKETSANGRRGSVTSASARVNLPPRLPTESQNQPASSTAQNDAKNGQAPKPMRLRSAQGSDLAPSDSSYLAASGIKNSSSRFATACRAQNEARTASAPSRQLPVQTSSQGSPLRSARPLSSVDRPRTADRSSDGNALSDKLERRRRTRGQASASRKHACQDVPRNVTSRTLVGQRGRVEALHVVIECENAMFRMRWMSHQQATRSTRERAESSMPLQMICKSVRTIFSPASAHLWTSR